MCGEDRDTLRRRIEATSDWLRDALEGLAHSAGINRVADYGPKPNGVLLDDLHQWMSAVRCRHCDTIGTPGEDHTCSCPKHENDCTEHLSWPSTTGLPWTAIDAARAYVDDPGNWSALDGRRAHLLRLLSGDLP